MYFSLPSQVPPGPNGATSNIPDVGDTLQGVQKLVAIATTVHVLLWNSRKTLAPILIMPFLHKKICRYHANMFVYHKHPFYGCYYAGLIRQGLVAISRRFVIYLF